jgi:ketosteroid isomerase-like protein
VSDNVELVRGLYSAFARGDAASVMAALSPDIVWTEAEGFPYAGTYEGPDAVLKNVFMRLATEWEGYSAVPHEFVAQGEMVVALGQYGGTYRATRKSFSAPYAHVWTLRDGMAIRFRQYTDTVLVQAALKQGEGPSGGTTP